MSDHALQVGDVAPEIELPDESGKPVKLSDFRGKRVVLYFYPKDDTSGCTRQACGFRDSYDAFEQQNAVVIGISPDSAKSHQKFKTKHDLPFMLLVDEAHAAAEAYGVWGEKKMYGKTYMGVTRSHFVIDEDGKLVDAQVKVKPEESPQKALQTLQEQG